MSCVSSYLVDHAPRYLTNVDPEVVASIMPEGNRLVFASDITAPADENTGNPSVNVSDPDDGLRSSDPEKLFDSG